MQAAKGRKETNATSSKASKLTKHANKSGMYTKNSNSSKSNNLRIMTCKTKGHCRKDCETQTVFSICFPT